ncbi:MAG: PHP domain-containing protein [Parahaliea sp.]
MLIDFHTHTTASDGELSPSELLERAQDSGLRYLAMTDHDTVDGYLAVRAQAADGATTLVPGVEISCRWSGVNIHLVGLGMAVEHPVMTEGLAQLSVARRERARTIDQRLAKLGFEGALEGAGAEAGQSQLGRPHFAAWMLKQGHVDSVSEAFDKYLGQGKTGDVKAFWPTLAEVTGWVIAAGGIAVLAHPLKYKLTHAKLRRLVADFQDAGGAALELVNGRQNRQQTATLRRLAGKCGLAVSAGSDFHRDSQHGADLGLDFEAPEGLVCVSELLPVAGERR